MFDVKILVPARILIKIFLCVFLHNAFPFGVRQRRPNFILHTILEVGINFMNKGLSVIKKILV